MATQDCGQDPTLMESLGGTSFHIRDAGTYWTGSEQFYTWWKNNVERKSKFLALSNDSKYNGHDLALNQRAMYCRSIIALTLNIKSHFGKFK